AADVDLRNPRRVIRALEILDGGSGRLRASRRRAGGRPARLLGLDVERAEHERLIRSRAEAMFEDGALLREAREALERGVTPAALARSGIGYREALGVLGEALSVEQAVEAVVARSLRYAKAQRTWFRHRRDVTWLTREPGDDAGAGLVDAALQILKPGTGC
ncbi:MAG: tRNA (adenosine(37)-N6)-dimethylallyltransferase MiaA, partial [Candidatus Dormibacteria bacterium]